MPNDLLSRSALGGSFAPEDGAGGGASGTGADSVAKSDETKTDVGKTDETKKVEPSDREKELEAKLTEISGLNAKIQKDLEAAQSNLKRFQGIDPEQVRKLIAEQTESTRKDAEKRGDMDALKKIMSEQHATETAGYRETITKLEAQIAKLSGTVNDLTIGSAFESSKFISDELVLTPAKARVIYGSNFEIEDGVVVAYDKPRGAESRVKVVDGQGKPLGFEAAVKYLVERDPERDRLLRSSLKPGAASATTDAGVKKTEPELRGISRITAGLVALQKAKSGK